MVVPSASHLQAFAGGQMTDLPEYSGGIDPTALVEIVSPGNVDEGVNYSITVAQLGAMASAGNPTIIRAGPTYASVASDTRILVNLAVAGPITITLLLSLEYLGPILVKDIAGNVDDANPITVVFTGGESVDGMTSVVISNPRGWFWFNPLAAGNFYET